MDRTDQIKAESALREKGFKPGNGKAWTAGGGTALGVLALAALGKWTGIVEVPDANAIEEAFGALGVAIVAGAGVAWRTYAVPYLRRIAGMILVTVIAGGLVSGCEVTDQAVDYSTGAYARVVDEACERGMSDLAIEARKRLVEEINRKTEVGNHTPSDCDSDGLPDFGIDAEGLPLPGRVPAS